MKISITVYLKIAISLLIAFGSLHASSAFSNEAINGLGDKNGFSEFAPPAPFNHKNNNEKHEWRSGSSFKSFNSERYADSKVSRNPWKPVQKFSKKQTFNGQRPWGNVPQKTPGNANNMRFHDQRFKQWLGRADSLNQNNYLMNETNFMNNNSMYPGAYATGYVPGGYVPFVSNSPGFYGFYPGAFNPYSGRTNSPWSW